MPASSPRATGVFTVTDACTGCMACVENCPAMALRGTDAGPRRTLEHNLSLCARCGRCWRICPEKAVRFDVLLAGVWARVGDFALVRCESCGGVVGTPAQTARALEAKAPADGAGLCERCRRRKEAARWPRDAGPRTKSSAGYGLQATGSRKPRRSARPKPEARSLKPGPGGAGR